MKQLLSRRIAPLFNCPSIKYFPEHRGKSPILPSATILWARSFSSSRVFNMANLKVDLTAPNGRKITLPTGLFINNEFVKATGGQTITSINPR
jgi:hypothetical protein